MLAQEEKVWERNPSVGIKHLKGTCKIKTLPRGNSARARSNGHRLGQEKAVDIEGVDIEEKKFSVSA